MDKDYVPRGPKREKAKRVEFLKSALREIWKVDPTFGRLTDAPIVELDIEQDHLEMTSEEMADRREIAIGLGEY